MSEAHLEVDRLAVASYFDRRAVASYFGRFAATTCHDPLP